MQHQKSLHLFNSLGPANGKLSGEKARSYLLSSNLPTHSLKTIWDQSDKDRDGQLTYEEFHTAVLLVNKARNTTNQAIGMSSLRGVSGNAFSNFQTFSQHQSFSQPVTSQNQSNKNSTTLERRGSLPSSSSDGWAVDANSKKRYLALFNKFDSRRTGSLGGEIAKAEFTKSGLPLQTLSHIWSLADITKTGSLSADEFCVAMYLIENAQRGREPPETILPSLIPPQYRNVLGRERSLTAGHFDTLNQEAGSLEDKKRANYNKGQAELERRRQAKLESERKAKEAEEQAAAAAAEAARAQREVEERRRQEFQRQRTRSMEEIARRKEIEDEEKQTIDKVKMESWAIQRKQQLETQLVRLTDITSGLRVRRDLLDREFIDLRSRCDQTRASLVQCREETKIIELSSEKLRDNRASILHEVTVAKRAAMSSQSELGSITNDKVRLSQQLRTLRSVDEVMSILLGDQDKARLSILALQAEDIDVVSQLEHCQTQMLNCNVAHQEMRSRLKIKTDELREKEKLLAQLHAQNKERLRQEEEKKRRMEEERRRVEERESAKKRIEDAEIIKELKRIEEEQAALIKERKRIESVNNELTRTAQKAASTAQAAKLAQDALLSHQERANLLIKERKKKKAEEMEKAYKKLEEMRAKQKQSGHSIPSTDSLVCLVTPTTPLAGSGDKLRSRPGKKPLTEVKSGSKAEGKGKTSKGSKKSSRPISISLPTSHPDFDPGEGPSGVIAELKAIGEPIYEPINKQRSSTPSTQDISSENLYTNTPLINRKSIVSEEISPPQVDLPDLMSHETPQKTVEPTGSLFDDRPAEGATYEAVNDVPHSGPEDVYMNIDSYRLDPAYSDPAYSVEDSTYLTALDVPSSEPDDIYMNIDPYRLDPAYQEDEEDEDEFREFSGEEEEEEEHIYSIAQPLSSYQETLFDVVALYDFCGDVQKGELEFKEGDRIRVQECRGEDWYFGQLDDRSGIFPVNFVEKCEWIYSDIGSINKVVVALYPFQSEEVGDLSFDEGQIITVTEDLGEWLKGECGTKTGIFPSTFVKERKLSEVLIPPPCSLLPSADIKPHGVATVLEPYTSEDLVLSVGAEVSVLALDQTTSYVQAGDGKRGWISSALIQLRADELLSSLPVGAERIPASLHCISLYQYIAQKEDELSFKENDIITITEQSDPHWWIGRLGNSVGVLPANFVEQINDTATWDTTKAWSADQAPDCDRTRQEAIHELILTEKSYIDDLLLVIEIFYNPLCAVASPKELSEVFVNWHQLILCNAKLFRALFNNRQNNLGTVGAVIVEEIDNLTLPYTKFCSCQRQAMLSLQESISPKFREVEKECGASPKVGKLPLSTFLLKPMQRITKYPLLIKKILQHSKESDPDYGQLKVALGKTETLLVAVNEAVRTTSRLEVLQKVLISDDLGEKIILNSNTNYLGERKLLHYGGLSKTRGAKELFGVLFNDLLWLTRPERGRYGNKQIDLDARDFDSIKFEQYREPLLLNDIILSEPCSDSIQFTHKDKPYVFHAVSESQNKVWFEHLSACVNEATSQYNRMYQTMVPDPMMKGQATLSLRVVEAAELALPPEDKQTSIYAQISLLGHVQRTPTSTPKWDHTMHFVVKDVNVAKVNITVHKANKYSPNISLGKFDLSLSKLLRSGTGPWNKRLILTDALSGIVNVSITLRHHGTASILAHR